MSDLDSEDASPVMVERNSAHLEQPKATEFIGQEFGGNIFCWF